MLGIAMHIYKRKKHLVKNWISIDDRKRDCQTVVNLLQDYKDKNWDLKTYYFLPHLPLFGFVLVFSY